VITIMSRICDAMGYAHDAKDMGGDSLGIVHRDINPYNLLVSYSGEPKIIDFGIAKSEMTTHKTEAGTIKGKFVYMSPEQSTAEELDSRSDIFSLGICLYECLIGKNPFARGNAVLSLDAIQRKDPEVLSSFHADLACFEPIIAKALAKTREARYQTCTEMAKDLRDLLQDDQVERVQDTLADYMEHLFHDKILAEKRMIVETDSASTEQLNSMRQATTLENSDVQPLDTVLSEELQEAPAISGGNTVSMAQTAAIDSDELRANDGFGAFGNHDVSEVQSVSDVLRSYPRADVTDVTDDADDADDTVTVPVVSGNSMGPAIVISAVLALATLVVALWVGRPSDLVEANDLSPQEVVTVPENQRNKPLSGGQGSAVENSNSTGTAIEVGRVKAGKPGLVAGQEIEKDKPSVVIQSSEAPADKVASAAVPKPISKVENEVTDSQPPERPAHKKPSRNKTKTPKHPSHRQPAQEQVVSPKIQKPDHREYGAIQISTVPPVAVVRNGKTVGQSFKLLNRRGTVSIGGGTDVETDPFSITILYEVKKNAIWYSAESQPWAIVRRGDGIGLGKTPLTSKSYGNRATLEFVNPKHGLQQRVTLRFQPN